MRVLLVMLALLISIQAHAVDCNKHPVYCHIKRLKPNMEYVKAMSLANSISSLSKVNKVDKHVTVAVGMQESGLTMQDSCQYFVSKELPSQLSFGCTDLGMFQIHVSTALDYKLDLLKLSADLTYNVKAYFLIMKDKLKMCKHLGRDAWTCYHSTTEVKRKVYKQLVERWL